LRFSIWGVYPTNDIIGIYPTILGYVDISQTNKYGNSMDVHCQQWEHGIKKQQWWYKTNNNGDMSLDMDGILMGHISNLI